MRFLLRRIDVEVLRFLELVSRCRDILGNFQDVDRIIQEMPSVA
jgi:hypothetical protein